MGVPVVFAPLALQPDVGRIYATIPEGWTIEQIICDLMPYTPDTVLDRVVVTMINGQSSARVPRRVWHRVRPHAGTQIIIMIAPGRAALNLLIAVAAIAISTFFAPGLAGLLGISQGLARGIIGFGVTALGGLLVNLLFPVRKEKEERPTYAVSGWQNEYRPDDVIPRIFGTIRYAPPLAAFTYIEVVGDLIYNRMVVLWGYGPVELSDLKNGETLLSKYDEIEIEHRYGYPDDEPLTLYTQQIVEEKVGTDLVREFQRDDAGNPLPGGWTAPVDEKPIERTTARDAAYAIVILSFPSGLGYTNSDNEKIPYYVFLNIRIKPADSETWTDLGETIIRAKKFAGFFRQIRIDFPTRGAWTIEITRMSVSEQPEDDVGAYVMLCTWAVLQSFRPEYPFNFSKPVALTAVRVKSTYQLNGALDALNAIVKGVEADWDAEDEEWTERASQNPASHALFALRGPMLYRARTDSEIDLNWFAEWHEFCEEKGLKYNRAHDFDESFGERLAAIGASGRAAIRWDGRRWTGVIDKPRDIPADHITPRNASGISVSQAYFEPPHAYRVQFADETNEFQPASRTVPFPGHEGEISVVEEIQMPGKTDPDEIFVETTRRQYEMLYRSTVYTATQQGLARTSTSGDLVLASRDIVRRAIASARVIAVRDGDLVEIDEKWTMVEGIDYAIRFRKFDADDVIGESVVRTIARASGDVSVVRLTGTGDLPQGRWIDDDGVSHDGDLVMFGPAGSDSYRLIVVDIERGKDNAAIMTMLPEAAIIDELTDARAIPTWSGRVGAEITTTADPVEPVITSIAHGVAGTGGGGEDPDPDGLIVYLRPGAGSSAVIATFQVRHRLNGSGTWLGPEEGAASSGAVDLSGIYSSGDEVELSANAVSDQGVEGPYGPSVVVTIGSDDAPAAAALASYSLVGGLGHLAVNFTPGANTTEVRLFRVAAGGTLDTETDGIMSVATDPLVAYSRVYGDASISNQFTTADFSATGAWTGHVSWGIAAGKATHTPGTAGGILQAGIATPAGAVRRMGATISGRTAGGLTSRLTGGTTVVNPSYQTADGVFLQSITGAVGDNTQAGFLCDSPFDGSIDDAVTFLETAACAPQGVWDFYIGSYNEDGALGVMAGPLARTIY